MRYEKPQILRHHSGSMNKFGRGCLQRPLSALDGVDLKPLAEEFGTPLYLISEKTLLGSIRAARRAFDHRYPRATLAWSYKTNYLKAVRALLHREGAWAEVVSPLEYEMARALGMPGSKIIYNGLAKTQDSLKRAVREGAIVHADHFDDIAMLEKAAASQKSPHSRFPMGIRINLDAGVYPPWHHFGFNLESGQALEAARRVRGMKSLALKGLHCHLGTFILDKDAYRRAMVKLLDFSETLKRELGVKIEWLDCGGGFASINTLRSSYLMGEHLTPSIDEYAACVTEPILKRRKNPADMPDLYIESGRAIVDEAGSLLSSVLAAKRLPDGKNALVIDAGVNSLFTAFWYKHDIALTTESSSMMEDTVIYGPTCMDIDVVRESVQLPPLARGDLLLIKNAGAYNMTQWMQFITERPAVVLLSEGGKAELIRERETLEDMTAPERLPARLKGPSPRHRP